MGKAGATRRRARSPRRRIPRARAMRSRTALSAARVVPKAAAITESAVGETHVATRRRPGQTTRLRRDCAAGDGSGLESDGAVPGHRHLHDAIAPGPRGSSFAPCARCRQDRVPPQIRIKPKLTGSWPEHGTRAFVRQMTIPPWSLGSTSGNDLALRRRSAPGRVGHYVESAPAVDAALGNGHVEAA